MTDQPDPPAPPAPAAPAPQVRAWTGDRVRQLVDAFVAACKADAIGAAALQTPDWSWTPTSKPYEVNVPVIVAGAPVVWQEALTDRPPEDSDDKFYDMTTTLPAHTSDDAADALARRYASMVMAWPHDLAAAVRPPRLAQPMAGDPGTPPAADVAPACVHVARAPALRVWLVPDPDDAGVPPLLAVQLSIVGHAALPGQTWATLQLPTVAQALGESDADAIRRIQGQLQHHDVVVPTDAPRAADDPRFTAPMVNAVLNEKMSARGCVDYWPLEHALRYQARLLTDAQRDQILHLADVFAAEYRRLLLVGDDLVLPGEGTLWTWRDAGDVATYARYVPVYDPPRDYTDLHPDVYHAVGTDAQGLLADAGGVYVYHVVVGNHATGEAEVSHLANWCASWPHDVATAAGAAVDGGKQARVRVVQSPRLQPYLRDGRLGWALLIMGDAQLAP